MTRLLVICGIACAACTSSTNDCPDTGNAIPSVAVIVVDAKTAQPDCNATVVSIDASGTRQNVQGCDIGDGLGCGYCLYGLGKYQFNVSQSGYQTATYPTVNISGDTCGNATDPQSIEITLVPQ